MPRHSTKSTGQFKDDDIVIIFLGPTGCGKSYFINLLTDGITKNVNNNLTTQKHDPLPTRIPNHSKHGDRVVLVDTAGFDDTSGDDMLTMTTICDWLKKCGSQFKPTGIVFLRRIVDNRYNNAAVKYQGIVKDMCGEESLNQVVLVTTHWPRSEKQGDKGKMEEREEELKNIYWKDMVDKGSSVERMAPATRESAWKIVDELIEKGWASRRTLKVQEVMVREGDKPVQETTLFAKWFNKLRLK